MGEEKDYLQEHIPSGVGLKQGLGTLAPSWAPDNGGRAGVGGSGPHPQDIHIQRKSSTSRKKDSALMHQNVTTTSVRPLLVLRYFHIFSIFFNN